MKKTQTSLFFSLAIACLSLSGCGSDSGGGLTSTSGESAKWVGSYKMTDIVAFDHTYYDSYRFTISSGSCGFQLSSDTAGWYLLVESNDCRIRNEYGDTYPIVSASRLRLKIDAYGSISEVDSSSIGTSSNNTSTATILAMDLTFGTSSAVMKTTKRLGSGDIYDYTYSYSKK